MRAAFSLVPEYLRTLDRDRSRHRLQRSTSRSWAAGCVPSSCGCSSLVRPRGSSTSDRLPPGAGASACAAWVDDDPDWERLAPAPFSTVCFRYRPARLAGREDEPEPRAWLDAANTAFMDAVNRTGEVFLSHTRLRDRFTIRIAIGNLRTEPRHVERAWALLRHEAARLDTQGDPA